MELSVIIISWNAERDVKACIDSVLKATSDIESEILVVDNGSTDKTVTLLQKYGSRIHLVCNNENLGISRARNIALKLATGRLVWILDIDTIVNRFAVESMHSYLHRHPETGICACRLVSEKGDVQDSCRKFPHIHYKVMNVSIALLQRTRRMKAFTRKLEKLNSGQFYRQELSTDLPFEAEYVIGACQMFRREVLLKAGLLDENIFYGPEDADFCIRIRNAGYKIVCLPNVHIIHHYNRITNKRLFTRMSFLHIKGLFYFYTKHSILSKI